MRTASVAFICAVVALIAGAERIVAEEATVTLPDKRTVIATLGLEAHVEGGYFARTFQPDHRPQVETPRGPRYTMTSIHYLLTNDSPIGHWHRNESDIVHFYHLGAPVHYYLLHPDGRLEQAVLGPDLAAGQRLQLTVHGGVWKASHLPAGEYGLISEAVAPGFDYADMALGKRAELLAEFPQHADVVRAYTRK
ncbi:cupin domain-containing protein [Haliea sp. E1-2-M8]|uniref:cupin domain-containing protein n=1 Tax=Haliea sp. E1-2-M8 TaxID=3064706 RepID=UPI00271C4EA5|nr:cupin domain-containing protein [Haliea sp. E1-2-M8]MDO8860530.1 cupin domain-containing protein [Haliea sp. E1-2-M8]